MTAMLRPAFVLCAVALCACAPSRFIKSDGAFVEVPRTATPELFVEAAPPRPWRIVGVVELTLKGSVSEAEVIAMALELGQKSGCELLSQGHRPQARVGWPRVELASLRIAHDHGDHGPPPAPERDSGAAREAVSTSGSTSTSSSSSGQSGGDGPAGSSGGGGSRVRRWRFDCGVYADAVSHGA